jgi:hypothetical protein
MPTSHDARASADAPEAPATDGGTEHAQHRAESAPLPAPAPRKRSPYAMSKGDASMRNIGWALGLTMACVIVVGVIFFGVGRGVDREIPETSRLDVDASAQRAQEQAPFPVAVPELGSDWTPRAASYSPSERPTWELRFTSPANTLVSAVESEELTASQLSAAMPGAAPEGETTIQGTDCETLSGENGQRGISCEGDGWGILVHGAAEQSDLESVADGVVASIRAGGAGAQ